MNKSLRIIAISLISTFFIFCTSCFAVNIDMNLSSNMIDSTSNTTYNSEAASSTQSNESNVTQNLVSGQTSTVSKNTNIPDILQALPESELGLTNILNILLIAIGLVLILLSIAIFIRLKH